MDPKGKVALITGAASGVGRATVILLASRGARVVAADIDEAGGAETVRLAAEAGGEARFARTDVMKWEDLARAVALAEEAFGGLDIMHNNAGVLTGEQYPTATRQRWERTLSINLWGVIAGTQIAIPALQRRGGGVIVSTASVAAFVPYYDDPVYAATKHGIVGLTRSLQYLHHSQNIRVNAVCPGGIDTPLVAADMSKMTPEELAARERLLARFPLMPPSQVAEAVLRFIEDDSLAGQALHVMSGREPTFVPQPINPYV
jgi:NAD(P)-dependent dehydrogenase (short-subunit alcohol dehydrogenase family)